MLKLVLIRHGQSTFNADKRFCGWTDAQLTEQGVAEAQRAGRILRDQGYHFDEAFTSYLSRAIKTLWIVLEEMNLMWIPVENSWRLNERHYGDLQERNHEQMRAQVGDEQVQIWRRSFDVAPPALPSSDPRHPSHDPRYAGVSADLLPGSESLKDTITRILPYWEGRILPELHQQKNIIISAHGNSLRALVKYLDQISDADIVGYEIPTGVPLVYELDGQLKPIRSYYLSEEGEQVRT